MESEERRNMHGRGRRSGRRGGRATAVATLVLATGTAFAGDLTGRVADATGVHGLEGAEIQVGQTGRRGVTGPGGNFRILELPVGTHEVTVRYPGTRPYVTTVAIPETGSRAVEVRLQALAGYSEEMVVIGQRASQASALARQRHADSIKNVLTRDVIGQFPDQNVSEAVRRLPGVSVQNDQGEGRFIVLRGLDPSLNAASLNGVRMTAPESGSRAIALDVLPAELIDSIEVRKSLVPEMDGDAIGGSIDIRTPSALDRTEPYLALTAAGSFNDLVEEWSPKAGLDASFMLTDRLGISAGLSYFARELGSDNIEVDDWTDADGIVYAESMELRDYLIERTRIGATLGLDYIATPGTTLHMRGVYSSFEDQEYRSRLSLDFGDAEPVAGDGTSARFDLGPGEELSVERDIKDRNEIQEIISLALGGETIRDAWTFNYEASWTYAEEDESDTFDPTVFERTFEAGELAISQIGTGGQTPRVLIDAASAAAFADASGYEFDEVEQVNGLGEDEEYALRFDIARELSFGATQVELKGGAKARWRTKSYEVDVRIFDGFDGPGDFLLSDVARSVDYGLGPINPTPSPGAVRRFLGDLSAFELDEFGSAFDSAVETYEVDEDILAGYLQARIERGPWRWVTGVRVESTDNQLTGNRVVLVEEGGTIDGVVVDDDTLFVTPVRFDKSDVQWLPSVNLRYEASDQVVLRAAAYRSLFRPNIEDIAPRFVVEQNDEDEREGEFGNPDLDPYTAWNIDAGVEWYFADSSVLQAGVFFKQIDDFIVRSVVEDVTFNGIFANEAVIPFNGDEAEVLGIELAYQQALTYLPAPWDGLLIAANYTWVDSEGRFGDRDIALPGTSEHVASVSLGYEKGPLSLRIAYVYRDEYLDEVSDDGEADRFIDEHGSLDLKAQYQVNQSVLVFLEAINLTDEPFVALIRTPDYGDRIGQYEEYSFTVNLGFRATF